MMLDWVRIEAHAFDLRPGPTTSAPSAFFGHNERSLFNAQAAAQFRWQHDSAAAAVLACLKRQLFYRRTDGRNIRQNLECFASNLRLARRTAVNSGTPILLRSPIVVPIRSAAGTFYRCWRVNRHRSVKQNFLSVESIEVFPDFFNFVVSNPEHIVIVILVSSSRSGLGASGPLDCQEFALADHVAYLD
jgi:hypothetical protein